MRSRLMANSPRITASVSSVMANGGRPSGASTSASPTTSQTNRVTPFMRSGFLAEQAARPHHEDGQHHQVHEGEREIGCVVVAEHLEEADQQRADQRAEEAAHAADDDDHEG